MFRSLRCEPIEGLWKEHLAATADHWHALWVLLTLETGLRPATTPPDPDEEVAARYDEETRFIEGAKNPVRVDPFRMHFDGDGPSPGQEVAAPLHIDEEVRLRALNVHLEEIDASTPKSRIGS